jgi:hypothetical protein
MRATRSNTVDSTPAKLQYAAVRAQARLSLADRPGCRGKKMIDNAQSEQMVLHPNHHPPALLLLEKAGCTLQVTESALTCTLPSYLYVSSVI